MPLSMRSRPPRLRLQSSSQPAIPLFHRPNTTSNTQISQTRNISTPTPTRSLLAQSRPQCLRRPMLSTAQTRSIRILPVGKRKHPLRTRFNNHPSLPTLGSTPLAAYDRKLVADTLPLRTGALAVKRGMTAIYIDASGLRASGANEKVNEEPGDPAAERQAADGKTGASRSEGGMSEESFAALGGKPAEGGRRIPATVLQLDRCQVVGTKTREKHGYFAVVVGEGWRKPKRVGKAMMGHYAASRVGKMTEDAVRAQKQLAKRDGEKAEREKNDKEKEEEEARTPQIGLPPKREAREFKVRDARGLLPIGAAVTPSWFQVGQFVDARGTARGMGFAGGMKRHGFHGQPASHGVSLTHRSMGSAGGGQGSGSRVHPGKKMAGNMGGQRHTIQNLKVLMVDEPNGLVVVQGAVSGRKGDLVMLSDAVKKPWPTIRA